MDTADLEAWYKAYTNADGRTLTAESDVVQAVLSDELDHAAIAVRVQRYLLTTKVDEAERLCVKCLYLTRHWPNLPNDIDWAEVVACGLDTEELEAGSLCGCRFCHYLFFRIGRAKLLGACRKIEARLRKLEIRQTASLSVQIWGCLQPPGSQLLGSISQASAPHIATPQWQVVRSSCRMSCCRPVSHYWLAWLIVSSAKHAGEDNGHTDRPISVEKSKPKRLGFGQCMAAEMLLVP